MAARLRLMRFLSKRFTAAVFRSAHQSKPLRAPTELNNQFGDGAAAQRSWVPLPPGRRRWRPAMDPGP